jgi:hypothetical protein
MAHGPGKYDAECTAVQQSTGADVALVIVIGGKKGHVPLPGALTVCASCAAVSVFSDEMLLLAVTPEEFEALPTETRDEISSIQALIILARTRRVGEQPPAGEA